MKTTIFRREHEAQIAEVEGVPPRGGKRAPHRFVKGVAGASEPRIGLAEGNDVLGGVARPRLAVRSAAGFAPSSPEQNLGLACDQARETRALAAAATAGWKRGLAQQVAIREVVQILKVGREIERERGHFGRHV